MKIFTRIAATITAALVSFFVAAPAFASEEVEKFNPADQFSSAGQPGDTVSIFIVGAFILAVVLLTTQLGGNLFETSSK